MTQQELYTALKSTGLEVAYSHFDTPPPLPYVVYVEESRDIIPADDTVYYKFKNFRIELYTAKKDPASELLLEAALDNAEIFYTASDVGFIESEALYEVAYYIQI